MTLPNYGCSSGCRCQCSFVGEQREKRLLSDAFGGLQTQALVEFHTFWMVFRRIQKQNSGNIQLL